MKAPFPWFGGKSKVADLVWQRFGNVPNYVEPFFGSGAVLLSRPHSANVETVNDKDTFLANFWRALQADPETVASYADWPVNEADLHARHWWLVNQAEFQERMKMDPDYHDPKIAGWWVWGICQWIGSGWCKVEDAKHNKRPHLATGGKGIHADRVLQRPAAKRPHLGNAGMGINRPSQKLPHLGDAGRGVQRPSQQLPHVGNPGMGDARPSQGNGLYAYMCALADRLRRVRVCCGEWDRILGPSVTEKIGLTGVFLDPPYTSVDRDSDLYTYDSLTVAQAAAEWAIANGDNPKLRIALCGYEGDYDMPDGWACVEWKARGGYSSQSRNGNDNPHKERIWFSSHCLNPTPTLFDAID